MGIRQILAGTLVVAGLAALLTACASGEAQGATDQLEDLLAEHGLHAASEPVKVTLNSEGWKYFSQSAQHSSHSIGLELPEDLQPPLTALEVELEDQWGWNDRASSAPSALSAYFLVDDDEVVGAWLGIENAFGGFVPLDSPEVIHATD